MHDHSSVDRLSPADQKIALYRSLFRGRDDVYARRFENQFTGKSGLTAACSHEWVRGICEKPRIRCRDCAHQRWIPVSDDAIRWHLTGRDDSGRDFAMGIYPLGLDEKCWLLAMNFAELNWKDNVRSLLDTCHRLNLPVAVQRARSGQGGHLWWFFAESVPAVQARKLGCHLITESMCHRPQIGLGTYDQLVPIQDTLPREGYGGAIMLPLEKQAREFNNSLFLDEDFEPYEDQWRYLSGMRRIARRELDAIATEAARNDRVIGLPAAGPAVSNAFGQRFRRRTTVTPVVEMAKTPIAITLDSQIHVNVGGVPAGLRNEILRLAAFQNPEFARAQAMRLSTHGIPHVIGLAEDRGDTIRLPRGCLEDLKSVLLDWQVRTSYRDLRHRGRPLPASFVGKLTSDQEAAAKKLLQHDTGILSATTGFGKTVVASWLIAQRGVNTLILVHRRQLVAQWKERLSEFVQLPSDPLGQTGDRRPRLAGSIDVATIQSLTRHSEIDAVVSQYGQVIVDECHHLSARTYQELMNCVPAKYVVGLTATLDRHDGHHPMVMMQCGPVRHHIDPRSQATVRRMERAVWVRPTQFVSQRARHDDLRVQLQQLYTELTRHVGRNQAICEDVLQTVHQGRSPLVLTERNEHLDLLVQELSPMLKNLIVFRGGMTKSELARATKRLVAIADDEPRVLLATGRYVGEGFDDARLDTLFLTLPISWSGTLTQYVGRLHRIHEGKSDVCVYDYVDLDEPLLARMFDRRCRGYDALGYQLRIPANAVPGWPQDAVVPVEPGWKAEHGATLKRLVRDGIDPTLAESFIQASRAIPVDAQGVDRARSDVEAFLFHRLESIPVTRGRFVLNGRLPIPFGLEGEMEIDLLCTDLPIAIEVDGMQHLASVEAYRTDRRKDWLLQEHGYVVLRFLASDVMRDLEMVLDTILRTLTSRTVCQGQRQNDE